MFFRNFAGIMKQKFGLIAVCLGLLLYALAFLFGWTGSNALLFTALLLVLGGTLLHIWLVKHL